MPSIRVRVGDRAIIFTNGRWSPSDTGPDVMAYAMTYGEVTVYEVEVSHASIRIGHKAKETAPAQVSVEPEAGYTLVADLQREWPSVWFPQRAACRRYALYRTDRPDLAEQARVLAELNINAGWSRARLNYGPCNMKMPELSANCAGVVHAQMTSWLHTIRGALQGGFPCHIEDYEDGPVEQPLFGWRVHGPKDRGRPAGSGVYFDTGWQNDPLCAPLFWLQACCAHERAWHAYDRDTGQPITADDYADGALKYAAGTDDPNNGWLPEFLGVAPSPDPLPLPYDSAHSIRGVRHAIALSEMTDSPMARRMIASEAAQMRLQFGERGARPANSYSPPNLRNWIADAIANPNAGGGGVAGRIAGWPLYIWAQDIKVNGLTGSEKAADAALDWVSRMAPAHGICQRVHAPAPKPGDTNIWYDPTWDLAHSFEAPILYFGGAGCARQRKAVIPRALARAAISLHENVRKGPYYSGEVGPMDYPYVAHRDGDPVPVLLDGKGGDATVIGDATHQESFAALAYSATKDARHLENGLKVGTPAATIAEKRANLESRTKLYGSAFLLALYQGIS